MSLNKKSGIISLLVIIILILGVYFLFFKSPKEIYQVNGDTLYYSKDRGVPVFNQILREENENLTLYNISFMSRNFLNYPTRIYGILIMPKSKITNIPGIVLIPGGGGTKENEIVLGSIIANQGYAVLTIDQRGIGETGGYYISLEEDYKVFSEAKEPIQHLSVYDVLRTFDVLKQVKGVDKNNIAVAGESMGGKYAIIAAALDSRIKGVIAISSAGYNLDQNKLGSYKDFMNSIDPDNYINTLSPRKIAFFHCKGDNVVPIATAQLTFSKAKEPKSFHSFNVVSCKHGYSPVMKDELTEELKDIFDI